MATIDAIQAKFQSALDRSQAKTNAARARPTAQRESRDADGEGVMATNLRIRPTNGCLETTRRGAGGHGPTPAGRPAEQPGPPGNPEGLHSSSSSMSLGCGLA
jgi:hypothetical protein